MLVDSTGARFVNEAAPVTALATSMTDNQAGPYYVLFDSSNAEVVAVIEKGLSTGDVLKGASIEELADAAGAPQLAAARSLPLGLLRELSEKADAARAAMHGKMDAAKGRVAHAAMLCGSLSPYSVLARGYSIARKAGSVLKSSADASEGDRVEVQLAAGRLGCRVETIITEEEL